MAITAIDVTVVRRPALKGYLGALVFVTPALLFLLVFRYMPVVFAGIASLWQYSLLGGFIRFLGLGNYTEAFRDPLFWNSLWVVAEYLAVKLPIQLVLALAIALLLQRESPAARLARTLVLLPTVLSLIVVSLIWALMYHSEVGLINSLLSIVGIPPQTFLTHPGRAMPAIAIMMLWKDLGLSMLIFLAGLKGIPDTYPEAAMVDGASPWQTFRFVTLPLLARPFLYILFVETVNALQVFAPIFATTNGGPLNATRAVVFYIYESGFRFGEMGYASALSIILLLLTLAFGLVEIRLVRREFEY